MSDNDVVAVTFGSDSSKAYQAMSVLRQLSDSGALNLDAAAIVTRDENGQLTIPESSDSQIGLGFGGGSLLGMFIGILGGPLGMLIGWGTGALIGSAFDADRADTTDDVLGEFSRVVPPGSTALLAEVHEGAPNALDDAMASLGGTVVRRPASEVLGELEAAQDAAQAAADEARRVVKDKKKAERHEKFEERKTKLEEKLGIGKK